MQVATIAPGDVAEARAEYDRYRSLCRSQIKAQNPDVARRLRTEQQAAQKLLWHLSRGRSILKLSESFALAGIDARGWPRLAIERADCEFTWCRWATGSQLAIGQVENWRWARRRHIRVSQPGHSLALDGGRRVLRAVVPTIPPHLLPAGRLDRYHILWEAEWEPVAPKDPLLLQHLVGDAYAILAQWDLTEVERFVLSGRFQQSN